MTLWMSSRVMTRSSLEEAAFAKAHFPVVYMDATEKSAGFAGMRLLGVEPVRAYRGERAAVLLDCKKPNAVTAAYTLALSNAYTETADEQLFTAPFTAQSGTYLRADGTLGVLRAAFCAKLPTALEALALLCGEQAPDTAALLAGLKAQYPQLAAAKEGATAAKEIVRAGGYYNWNDHSPVIADFCDNY